mmetsp:Transcript_10919/g.18643  ORF Transcript_10919/g.18643 Transcript_10919/m.18643 type:complete len:129 (+) Transcript_10919:101-487(+)
MAIFISAPFDYLSNLVGNFLGLNNTVEWSEDHLLIPDTFELSEADQAELSSHGISQGIAFPARALGSKGDLEPDMIHKSMEDAKLTLGIHKGSLKLVPVEEDKFMIVFTYDSLSSCTAVLFVEEEDAE